MKFSLLRSCVLATGVFAGALCLYSQGTPAKEAEHETQGMPPRATPGDYQAHTQVGSLTLAAEFDGHFVPVPEGTLTNDDFVVVETALFGPADAKLKLSWSDFSIRINGKKVATPSQPYGMVASSLKDPNWIPPESEGDSKSKTKFGSAGGGPNDSSPPPTPKVPIELRRAMTQHTQKASLAEGERPLPQAGLIFFPFSGKAKSIRTVELIYSGPAGQATLELRPE